MANLKKNKNSKSIDLCATQSDMVESGIEILDSLGGK